MDTVLTAAERGCSKSRCGRRSACTRPRRCPYGCARGPADDRSVAGPGAGSGCGRLGPLHRHRCLQRALVEQPQGVLELGDQLVVVLQLAEDTLLSQQLQDLQMGVLRCARGWSSSTACRSEPIT